MNLTLSCSKVWIESTPRLIGSTPAHQERIWHTSTKMAQMNSKLGRPKESMSRPKHQASQQLRKWFSGNTERVDPR